MGFLSTTDLAHMKAKVKVYLNPVPKPMVQLSVTNFHFDKLGLIKHVSFVGVNGAIDR